MNTERRDEILSLVRSAERTSLEVLASHLGVSQMTVRRDLDELQRQGLLRRVRGGAVPVAAPPATEVVGSAGPVGPTGAAGVIGTVPGSWATGRPWPAPVPRLVERPAPAARRQSAEERIGRAVASSLSPGSSVLLDAGPVAEHVARHLPERGPLTVAVMDLPSAVVLAAAPRITLIVLGGQVQPDGRALTGPLASSALGELHVDVFVMSASAVGAASGWGAASLEEATLRRAAMQRADRTLVAAPAGALGARALARTAELGAVTALVTDTSAHEPAARVRTEPVLAALSGAGVLVTVV